MKREPWRNSQDCVLGLPTSGPVGPQGYFPPGHYDGAKGYDGTGKGDLLRTRMKAQAPRPASGSVAWGCGQSFRSRALPSPGSCSRLPREAGLNRHRGGAAAVFGGRPRPGPQAGVPVPVVQHHPHAGGPHLGQGAIHTTPALHLLSFLSLQPGLSPPLNAW